MRGLALLLLYFVAADASPSHAAPPRAGTASSAERAQVLAMFARAYYPGRSGQIALAPRRGEFITRRGTEFMHGSPWDYDVRIPFVLWGPGRVRAGTFGAPVAQQDLAPTLARMLGVALPGATGRPLTEALVPGARRPRVVALLVLDGMRADYLSRYAAELPALTRLRREGASFDQARLNFVPSITSAGHATIATGADPRLHGIVVNGLFDPTMRREVELFDGLSPRNLMSLALADVWNVETDGRAIIVTQVSIGRAGGLAGHGACLLGARPTLYAAYDAESGRWRTDPACFRLHESYSTFDSRSVWEREGGSWMGHPIANADAVRRSAPFATFEGDALAALLERELIGEDEITDLIQVNLKVPDFVGHAYGADSAELRSGLVETDRQIARILSLLERKAARDVVVAVTADHGMPAEPPAGGRHYAEDIVKRLHERFDPEGKLVVLYGAENHQLFVDRHRLAELGLSLERLRDAIEELPFVFAAFTEDEIRGALDRTTPAR